MVVMQSLTRNGRKVFWILLDYQRATAEAAGAEYRGLRFSEYLGMCQQQFAAHDDSRLRTYLTEFFDHKLAVSRKFEGVEYISIPAEAALLASLREMMAENFAEDAPST